MNYDDIELGAPVTVTTRGNIPAVVVGKFKSSSAGYGIPAGTEYIQLERADRNEGKFLNYPQQLKPR